VLAAATVLPRFTPPLAPLRGASSMMEIEAKIVELSRTFGDKA